MLYTHMLKSTRYNMLVPSCDNLHVGTDPYTDLYQHEQAHMLVRNRKYLAVYGVADNFELTRSAEGREVVNNNPADSERSELVGKIAKLIQQSIAKKGLQ